MNRTHCITWSEVPEVVSPAGIGKRVIEGEDVSLVMIRVPAGITGDRHSHPYEQFIQVVAGFGRLLTEQGERAFTSGSVFHFMADDWHRASFDTEPVLIETNLRPASSRL